MRITDLLDKQSISLISARPLNGLNNALIITIPNENQYVDAVHCCTDWLNTRFLPNIHNYRYFAVRIINLDMQELCLSIMLLELPRLNIARLDEKVLDTAVTVVSYSAFPLSAPGAEFVKEFNKGS